MANELKTAEMLNSKVTSDKQDNVQSQNNPSNRDVNGVNDKNAVTRVNDSKTVLDKKPTANGDIKPPSSLPELKKEKSALKTPTKKISPKSPEISSANSLGDKKKVPMNKVQVGAAPSPNLKVVRSKIGSLENYTHKPGGGKVKIENRKLEWKVQPKIEAKNDKYVPTGGDKKITQVKLQWSAKSKIGSLENATHKPGGGDKKIESVKLDFKDKAKPKVGSKDNIKHVPGGGTVKKTTDVDAKSTSSNIEDQKLDIKAESKVGSLDNVKHRPGGGDKKIFDDKEYLKQTALTNESSKANSVTTSGSQAPEGSQICSRDLQQKENQPAASDTITVQNSDKLVKDHAKPKNEPKNSITDKRSQPSTPKKSLPSETKPTASIANKPTYDDKIAPEKIPQKSDTKINQKSKQDSLPQLKPELKKIPSKDEINLKCKVPVAQPRELIKMPSKDKIKEETNLKNKAPVEQSKKPEGNTVSDKSSSDGKNLSENKPDPIKEVVINEKNNNKVGTIPISKKPENSTDVQQISKNESENELSFSTKPQVEITLLKKQNSQPKIESKLNQRPIEIGPLKKQDSKSKIETKFNSDKKLPVEVGPLKKQDSKPEIETKLISGTNPPVSPLKKQDSKSKIESKSNLEIDKKEEKKESSIHESKPTQLESKLSSNVSTKNQTQSANNSELKKPSVDTNNKDKELKKDSMNQNLNSKIEIRTTESKDEPKLSITEKLETSLKDQSSLKTSNTLIEKPKVENNSTKIHEPSKPTSDLNYKVDDEKSNSLKVKSDKNQNDIVTEGTKPNSVKFSQPEMKQTSETFSPISKSDTESRPSTSTIEKQSTTISESKVTNVPVREKNLLSLNQTENPTKISINVAKDERREPPKNEISETSAGSNITSKNQPEPLNEISSTSVLKK